MRKWMGWLWLLPLMVWAEDVRVEEGQSVERVVEILGLPDGEATAGEASFLVYSGIFVKFVDGRVADLPSHFEARLMAAQKKQAETAAFVAAQMAKGLVLYDGAWITPACRDRILAEAKKRREQAHSENKTQSMPNEAGGVMMQEIMERLSPLLNLIQGAKGK